MSTSVEVLTRVTPDLVQRLREIDDPVAVVTGASSGIGRSIALNLAADHAVVAIARSTERLAALAVDAEAAGRILPLSLDLTPVDALQEAVAALPRVDVLVHDAAISERSTLEDATVDDWQRVLSTNVIAPAELTRALLPQIRAAEGTVVFISSGAARRAVPYLTIYSASKHALLALADGLRREEAAHGVRVATVAPGPTETPLAHVRDDYPVIEPQDAPSHPESVAAAVRFVIEAPADSQFTELWVRPRR
ncbi:SDR family oxidoreductase [Pseudoclavibacter sp. CFCC 11306]|uniref:SDR family oxidoreductase n=1 Tax=Pseudoclavibacter sp. CFCC 11306 TaxID=1564493 RepID=UPI001300FAB8|nr:SDR family oxidoreductase [Pseudoclavibacter sp. CFCC 11306]KAB1656971.1 SDR family oxidoreductase [Pseudoclavibacter sp. CFCC 11306]